MRFSQLKNRLENDYGLVFLDARIREEEEIEEIALLEAGAEAREKVLYVAPSDTFFSWQKSREGKLPEKRNLLLGLKKGREDEDDFSPCRGEIQSTGNILSYAAVREMEILKTLQAANNILHEEKRTGTEMAELMALTMKANDLKEMIASVSVKLENPIILIDSGFKILDVSSADSIDDPIWMKNLERGYCSYEFIREVQKLEEKGPFPSNSTAFEVICRFSLYRKLCSKIFWKNHLVGYVILLEKNKAKEALAEAFLPYLGSAVCEMLQRSEEHRGIFGSQRENLLYELLHGGEEELIRIRMKNSRMEFPEKVACLVVRPNEYLNSIHAAEFLKEQILRILPDSSYLKEKNQMVFIVRIQKDGKLKAEEEKRLLSLFHKGVEHMGISRPCENIMNLKEVYRQCIKLYRIRERLRVEDEIMYFEKYSFYVMISEMKERELFQFSHPALRTLREHDQAHNSELYETLCVFTRCRGHMIKAAEILSIHRNSLSYRISRILDLTGLDLQDDEEIFRLICGFKLEQYLRVSGSV